MLAKGTYGCEVVDLTCRTRRRFKVFNAKCLSVLSGRTIAQETRKPSFDILAWIRWRRLTWLGKALRGEKGVPLMYMLQWNYGNRSAGDVFGCLPHGLPPSFNGLVLAARDINKWQALCDGCKPKKWVRYDEGDRTNTRRSKRLTGRKSDARSLARETLRRQLRGRHAQKWPRPSQVQHGDLHIYTDGSATKWRGQWRAGCGVWFDDDSPLNISTNPGGRQTFNRAELTAVILALRRALKWPTLYRKLTIFSDSKYVVEGVNKYLQRWKTDG